MEFLKRIFNSKKRKKAENEQFELFNAELPFTKEEIYKEFNAVLKENPGKMDKECLERIECVEIIGMKMNTSKWIEMHYKIKYNNNIYERNVGTSDFETAKRWAEYFYGEIFEGYNPQENDLKVKTAIKKAAKEAKRNLIFTRKTLGYCHVFWGEQKRILKDKYGIDWKTPAERNPNARFD